MHKKRTRKRLLSWRPHRSKYWREAGMTFREVTECETVASMERSRNYNKRGNALMVKAGKRLA